MGVSETTEQDPEGEGSGEIQKRFMGKIQFPYTDLERAEELCRALLEIAGRAETEQTQLAVKLDMSVIGGTFRGRLSAAKMFGLIDTPAAKVKLTLLGRQILESDTRPAARATAFLKIELYAAMYERYNGYALPPAAAIERQMEELGVPPKQKERARQAFASSAQTAGFIASSGRFSKPVLAAPTAEDVIDAQTPENGGGTGGGGRAGGEAGIQGNKRGRGEIGGEGSGGGQQDDYEFVGSLDPVIIALVKKLPPAKDEWDAKGRVRWLRMIEMAFQEAYGEAEEIKISIGRNE
jgi:hypothetical protein